MPWYEGSFWVEGVNVEGSQLLGFFSLPTVLDNLQVWTNISCKLTKYLRDTPYSKYSIALILPEHIRNHKMIIVSITSG